MIRRISTILILTALLFALMSVTGFAKQKAGENLLVNKVATRVMDYAFPDEHLGIATGNYKNISSLNHAKSSNLVGEKIGDSYYEYQHNSSMHRQITIGNSPTCPWTVHFNWMYLPAPVLEDRGIKGSGYDGASIPGGLAYYYEFQSPGEYAGYPSLDVTQYSTEEVGNRSISAAHNRLGAGLEYRSQYWIQYDCNLAYFATSDRVPDTLNDCGNPYAGTADGEVVWPDIAYQDPPDGPPVLHMIASAFGGGSGASNLSYFQKVDPESGFGATGTWTYGCAIDTVFNGEGYDISAHKDGAVGILWVALLPNEVGCDTCSQNTSTGDGGRDRWDSDLYFQVNRNYGRGWLGDPYNPGGGQYWEPRQNITKNVSGQDGYRPYSDLSSLMTSDQKFHCAYVAMVWDDDDPGSYQTRIFHWSEDLGYLPSGQGNVRTVASGEFDVLNCNPGSFNSNQSKLAISECAGRLYVMWTELNSPSTTGNDNRDDCGQRAFDGAFSGAANGDLFISVAGDLTGLTWDKPRPLTDTYGGPTGTLSGQACDPAGPEGDCPSEHWPSMAEQGSDYVVNPPTGYPSTWNTSTALVGTHTNSYYLDVSYFHDNDPGGAIMGYGEWTSNDYLWMRFPCVDEVTAPNPAFGPKTFAFPSCIKNCQSVQVLTILENIGNADLTYAIAVTEDQPAYTNWFQYTAPGDGLVPFGVLNRDTIYVDLNAGGGQICAAPGTITHVTGRMTITHNAVDAADQVFEADVIVADTCVLPWWDVIATSCTELAVGTNGNAGNAGSGSGGVNLDYASEFPSEPDTNATVYLYDAGDVIGWSTPSGAIMNWGMFQATITDSVALMPQEDYVPGHVASPGVNPAIAGKADPFYTGKYVTNDSTIALESYFYANTDAAYSCGFVIKHIKVYSNDGLAHNGITIGTAADWDVPSDSGSDNAHGFGSSMAPAVSNLVWQRGVEYNANDPWDNSLRYAAMMYLGGYRFSTLAYGWQLTADDAYANPRNIYTGSNPRLVYPYEFGFDADTLYMMSSAEGENLSTWVDPTDPSPYYDMHSGMTYVFNHNLGASDTLHFFIAMMTGVNATYPAVGGLNTAANDAVAFFNQYLAPSGDCCDKAGDANNDGTVGISDLTYFVDYMFAGGSVPVCKNEFDNNADCTLGISDLTYFVDFMFAGGSAPQCGCAE